MLVDMSVCVLATLMLDISETKHGQRHGFDCWFWRWEKYPDPCLLHTWRTWKMKQNIEQVLARDSIIYRCPVCRACYRSPVCPPVCQHEWINYKKAVLSQRWPRDARYISRSWAVAEIWPFEITHAILNLFESKIAPLGPPSPKTPLYNQTWSGSDDRLRRYGHLKFFQDGDGRHLRFVRTVNSAIGSAVPENPTLEQNMKWIGSPVAEIWPFAYVGGILNPHFGGKGRS